MPKAVIPEVPIELTCSLCPNTPNFSDVSHLLTHISSKAHLAYRFKLQIRSQAEPDAKTKLDDFDFWYHSNNLGNLLAERLASKDKKKGPKQRKPRASKASATSVRTPNSKKEEQKSAQEVLAATPAFRAPIPRMTLWPTSNTSTPTQIRVLSQNHMYSTPTMRRQVPNFALAPVQTLADEIIESASETPWKLDESEGSVETDTYKPKRKGKKKAEKKTEKKVEKRIDKKTETKAEKKVEKKISSDSTTLKGVLWPGMDLFDSATPEMKRMRNQRKDDSVLDQMIATSNDVEANEIVYRLNGELHHIRDIFGPLSTENSPIHDPTPRKRNTRKALAQSDISINVPVARDPRPTRDAVNEPRKKRPFTSAQHHRLPPLTLLHGSTPNPLISLSQRFVPTFEEEEEFRMTLGEVNNIKKRPFAVYQEAPDASPGARTESTLEDHRFDFSGDRASVQKTIPKASDHASPTPAAKQSTMYGFGKENGSSGFSPTPRLRQHSANPSHIYPGQLFFDPMANPLYDPSFARSIPPHPIYSTSLSEHLKPSPTAHSRFHSNLHGHYRSFHPTSRSSMQQEYGPRSFNSGMH